MLTFRDDDVKDGILADTGLRPAFALESFQDLEADVRQSIARIQANPFIPVKDQVRGFIYDCATGSAQRGVRRLTRPHQRLAPSSRNSAGCWATAASSAGGGSRPSRSYASREATRPRGVRCRKPIFSRYGS